MSVVVVGLGPAGLERVPAAILDLLLDPERRVVVRTAVHPAATELAERRDVIWGDDLYERSEERSEVYEALAERVLSEATAGDVVYAVPGSPYVGERSVRVLVTEAARRGIEVEVKPGESFLDLVLHRLGIDPLVDGLRVLDAQELPYPLVVDGPTVIGHVASPLQAADVKTALGRVLGPEAPVTVAAELGSDHERVHQVPLNELDRIEIGPRTTFVVFPPDNGWTGLVRTVLKLRAECLWDARQTHHSLVRHLIEEAYETVEALGALGADAPGGVPDAGAYRDLEEELGDLLLQVLFHATLAREAGMFDIDEVSEQMRRKLVSRHPHVYGDLEVDSAGQVEANWERLKQEEKQRESLMDDVPASLPALARAAKLQRRAASVGFDWQEATDVLAKIVEEANELGADIDDPVRSAEELGDLLFSVVNLSRHLTVDPEMALRQAVDRFADRFRAMEAMGSLDGLTLEELDARWEAAKREMSEGGPTPR